MDLVLTSFGMGMDRSSIHSPFYRMPPLIMKDKISTLQLDYAALFICDRLIIDETSYNHAIDPNLEKYRYYSQDVLEKLKISAAANSKILKDLHESGHLVISNFDSVYLKTKQTIDETTKTDLKSSNISRCIKSLELSINHWEHFLSCLRYGKNCSYIQDDDYQFSRSELVHVLYSPVIASKLNLDLLKHWRRKLSPSDRNHVRKTLYDYLAYVNFNLILSIEFQSPFIDWADFQPFYLQKFSDLCVKNKSSKLVEHSRKLFEFVFPYFVPKSNRDLFKVLEDKRIEQLRSFIQETVNNNIEFDSKYVVNILKEVIKFERKAATRRSISGWITLPLGLIPIIGTGIQKAAEESINKIWANKPIKEYSWFYLINNLDASSDTK